MRRLIVLTALLAAVAASASAQPGPRGQRPGPPPGAPQRPSLFISPAGEPFREGEGLQAWFAGADGDRDGQLTPAEFRADAARVFRTLDKDGDGAVRGLELQAYERDVVPEIIGLYGGGEPVYGQRGREGAGRYGLLNIPQPITGADLDGDRRVTLAEFERSADIRFGLLDRANVGRLTLEGLLPPKEQSRKRR